ncbi:MAG TPA: hypothetical protein VFU06_06365 [Longimicrobiales bacterium]|nr:hypothetical protein [Longimicrobiales bacterium]
MKRSLFSVITASTVLAFAACAGGEEDVEVQPVEEVTPAPAPAPAPMPMDTMMADTMMSDTMMSDTMGM